MLDTIGRDNGCDFNPRPPRGGRPADLIENQQRHIISIHAPREGGDDAEIGRRVAGVISIHAPREGGDAGRLHWS